MAVTIDEQVRPWPTTARFSSDGAAFHSAFAYDQPRALNNLGTLQEPCLQFVCSAGKEIIGHTVRTWYARSLVGFPDNGMAFIGQFPIILPHQANRLIWTMSIERGNLAEVAPVVTISKVSLFLSTSPLSNLSQWFVTPDGDPLHQSDVVGTFTPDLVGSNGSQSGQVAYVQHDFNVAFAGSDTHVLAVDTTTGWEGFYKSSMIDTSHGAPMCTLIVGITFAGAALNDWVQVQELSIWGDYT